jgi:signal transduction histidine kinase
MSKYNPGFYLSLRDRLILNFVLLGAVVILIVGVFSYYTAREVLIDRTFQQLTSVKVMKKRQIESFFADRIRDIRLLAASPETKDLLHLVNMSSTRNNIQQHIEEIYSGYLARYLASRDYYKSLNIISEEGNVIRIPTTNYVAGLEQVTNVEATGDLKDLWKIREQVKELVIDDLEQSKRELGLFISIPIQDKGEYNMIAMEISIAAINKIMLENNPYEGLGESGESYLVGEDMLMRSISRFQDNSILSTSVVTQAVEMAFSGIDSTKIIEDYRGIRVLSSFGMVEIPDLHWAILAEIDLEEALVPLNAIRNNIIVISSFIILILFIAAVFLSRRITLPLIRLKNAAEKIGQANFIPELEASGLKNEIGDLTLSFNSMSRRLAYKTAELENERARRLRSVLDGQELERQRLSRELHDGLGQRIIALKLKLENINTSGKFDILGMIKEVKQDFDETIDDIRRMSNDLMPAVLYEFGLSTALRNLMDGLPAGSGIKGRFSSTGKFDDLDKTSKTYLYRIAQEAVNNALKHSGATLISLNIKRHGATIRMQIEDNGKGFDFDMQNKSSGNGIYNMHERAALLNGTLELKRSGKGGTSVIINIKLNHSE